MSANLRTERLPHGVFSRESLVEDLRAAPRRLREGEGVCTSTTVSRRGLCTLESVSLMSSLCPSRLASRTPAGVTLAQDPLTAGHQELMGADGQLSWTVY